MVEDPNGHTPRMDWSPIKEMTQSKRSSESKDYSNDVEKTYWRLMENKEVEEDDTTITEVEVSICKMFIESDNGFFCSIQILLNWLL